jgi:hypothetical protein
VTSNDAAPEQQEYLLSGGLYQIVADDDKGEQQVFNLLTGEAIP